MNLDDATLTFIQTGLNYSCFALNFFVFILCNLGFIVLKCLKQMDVKKKDIILISL